MQPSIILVLGILACIGYGVQAFPNMDPSHELHHAPKEDGVYGDHEDYGHEKEGLHKDKMHRFDGEYKWQDRFWQKPHKRHWEDDSAFEKSWSDEAIWPEGSQELMDEDEPIYDPEEYPFVFYYYGPANEFWRDRFGNDVEVEFYLPDDDFHHE